MRGGVALPRIYNKELCDVTKLRILLYRTALMLLVLLLSVACRDYDQELPTEEQPMDILSRFNAEGKAWLSLNLRLPTNMTRSEFADGDGAEYAVKTLMLVLFHGSSTDTEDELTVASTYDVGYTPVPDMHHQITEHSTATIQITNSNIRNSDQLYILAIANASPSIAEGATFANVKAMTLSNLTTTISGTEYFVMTNSPLASANDGTGNVTTLTKIDPTLFAPTEEDALTKPAGYVFLERMAAKVTTKLDNGLDMHIKGNADIDFSASDFHYSLFNYNTDSRLVRNMDATWLPYNATTKRFVESAALPNGMYRTYRATDVNYSGKSGLTASMKGWKSMGESDYCAENTFSVDYMTDDHSTSVLIALQLNGGNPFYTTSVTGSDVIYQMPANGLTEDGTSASETFARRLSNKVASAKTIDEYLREWLMETNNGFRNWVNQYAAGEPKHVNITVESKDKDFGLTDAKVLSVTQTARAAGSAGANAFDALNLKTYCDNNIKIQFYEHGWCYYRVLIRHFNDTQTPWSSTASMSSNTPSVVYGGDEASYLGRYGIVRNNWYNLNINSVTHVGSPIIPPLMTDADDKVEQLLNVTLQISGWEGHKQNL